MSILAFIFEILVFALIICGVANEEKLVEFERVIKIYFRKRKKAKTEIRKMEIKNISQKYVA